MALTLGALVAFYIVNPSPILDVANAAVAKKPVIKGPLIFVSNVLSHDATVVEPMTGRQRSFKVGSLPHNWDLSPDAQEAVLINTGSESVSYFDAVTGNFKRNMLIAPFPKNKYHDALGPKKFVGKTSCHQCHGPNAVGRLPGQATYALDGKHLWTVAFNPPDLVEVERATGKQLRHLTFKDMPFPAQPSNVIFTPDGKEAIVLHRREGRIKLPELGKDGKHHSSAFGGRNTFDHDAPPGNKASVITFHTPDLKQQTGLITVPLTLPFKANFNADGSFLYVSYRSTNKVAEIDMKERKVNRLLVVGEGPINAVVDKQTGKYLYAPSFYNDPPEVIKLEIKTGLVRALLPAKVSPAMVEQDKDTGLLYVVANANAKLLEIDPHANKGKGKITREWPLGAFPLDLLVIPESTRKAAAAKR